MSFFTQHVQRILDTYEGELPLSLFLRKYFKAWPKLGSRDRKALSEGIFLYYRCRHFFDASVNSMHVIALGYQLCKSNNAFLAKMLHGFDIDEDVHPLFHRNFSFNISGGLSEEKWLHSLWQQPQLFIRARKPVNEIALHLKQHDIDAEVMHGLNGNATDCLKIQTGKSIDSLLNEADYVVQDWSSQQSIYILLDRLNAYPERVWDVCSGAGGKSILLKDKLPAFDLTVSDIRASILHNLQARFKQYGLGKARSLEVNSADANALKEKLGNQMYDLVLCDVPCSGSGTWARTPEQFHFYKPAMLHKFKELQFPIASNASNYVKQGGYLAYITCSVFREENEDVVNQLSQLGTLDLMHSQIIDGINNQADCMFIAIFEKQS
jgi:16S rRNA (cytosine967-C5)-methyltransferase